MERILLLACLTSFITTIIGQTSPALLINTNNDRTNNLVISLPEDQSTNFDLDGIDCSDPDGQHAIASMTYSPTTGCNNCFVLELDVSFFPPATAYTLKFYPSLASFDFNTVASYSVTYTCSDQTDADTTQTVEVRLIPNSSPVWTNGLSETYTIANAQTVTSGTTVFTIASTDPDNDQIYYTMTCNPTTAPLTLIYTTGAITATADLKSLCEQYVICTASITDNKLANPDNQIITFTLGNYNQDPTISNFIATGFIAEDSATNTVVYTFSISDDYIIDTPVLTMIGTNPAQAYSLYSLTAVAQTYELRVAAALDYEDTNTRVSELIMSIDDGSCAVTTYTYTLTITDVNEAPVIGPTAQTYEVYEGTISLDPSWTTTDEDTVNGDTLTYSIKSMTPAGQAFQIDPNTGVLSSTADIDVDASFVTSITFTIEVTDSGGLTSDTTLILNLKDANDNAPTFDATNLDQYLAVTTCGATGKVGDIVATDADTTFEDNNVISYHMTSSSSYLAVSESGEVILLSIPALGYTETVKVDAIDKGVYPGNLTSLVAAEYTITVGACATTTAATPSDGIDDDLWWIILSGLLGLLFIGLLTWLCISRVFPYCLRLPKGHWSVCCKGNCCKRNTPKQPRPKKSFKEMVNKVKPIQSNKPKPGNDGFWKVVHDVMNKPSPVSNSDKGPDRFKGPQGHDAARNSPIQAPELDDPLYINRAYQDGFF